MFGSLRIDFSDDIGWLWGFNFDLNLEYWTWKEVKPSINAYTWVMTFEGHYPPIMGALFSPSRI